DVDQRLRQLRSEKHHELGAQRTAPMEEVPEVHPVDQLHDVEMPSVFAVIVDGDDVRVAQLLRERDLLEESLDELGGSELLGNPDVRLELRTELRARWSARRIDRRIELVGERF